MLVLKHVFFHMMVFGVCFELKDAITFGVCFNARPVPTTIVTTFCHRRFPTKPAQTEASVLGQPVIRRRRHFGRRRPLQEGGWFEL